MAVGAAALLPPVSSFGQPLSETGAGVRARPYYARCANLHYRGTHKLFRHALACAVAERQARYVLKHRTHPSGWHCSLDNLGDGYGACAKGRHAFEFLPL